MNLLLAAKQVKQESEECAAKVTTAILKDHVSFAFQPIIPGPWLNNVRRYEIHLIFYCHRQESQQPHICDAFSELNSHREWIKSFLTELACVQTVTINGYLCHYKQNVSDAQTLPCLDLVLPAFQKFRDLPKVHHLVLGTLEYDAENIDGAKTLDWEWAHEKA